jgi:hypothetical protein
VKAFPVVIHYRDWKNGGLQSKLIEVQQLSNIPAQTVVRYIKRTLENHRLLMKCISFVGGKWNTVCGGLWRNVKEEKMCPKNSNLLWIIKSTN